jgi:ferritin
MLDTDTGELVEKTLEHEQKVTSLINGIADQADKVNDRPTKVFIQWFVTEQVEEEKNASDIIEQLLMIDAKGTAVLMLDHQLGKRGE